MLKYHRDMTAHTCTHTHMHTACTHTIHFYYLLWALSSMSEKHTSQNCLGHAVGPWPPSVTLRLSPDLCHLTGIGSTTLEGEEREGAEGSQTDQLPLLAPHHCSRSTNPLMSRQGQEKGGELTADGAGGPCPGWW
jgi:hypothetical protein